MDIIQSLNNAFMNKEAIWFNTLIVFMMGACVGSFLNVVIFRIPKKESIVFIPSHCQSCDHYLRWFENIPIFSWLFLRGKCRHCGTKISSQYITVELITACFATVLWLTSITQQHFYWSEFLRNWVIINVAIAVFVIDVRYHIIPNKITYFLLFFGIIWSGFFPENLSLPFDKDSLTLTEAIGRSCTSALLLGGFLWIYRFIGNYFAKQDILGLGDVKYIAALAATLGGIETFIILLMGSTLGVFAGIALIIYNGFKDKNWKINILLPFGPFLAFASVFMIWGERLFTPLYQRFVQVLELLYQMIQSFGGNVA